MTAENIKLNVSGLPAGEQADRAVSSVVLLGRDNDNNTLVPISVSPEGWLLVSGTDLQL